MKYADETAPEVSPFRPTDRLEDRVSALRDAVSTLEKVVTRLVGSAPSNEGVAKASQPAPGDVASRIDQAGVEISKCTGSIFEALHRLDERL